MFTSVTASTPDWNTPVELTANVTVDQPLAVRIRCSGNSIKVGSSASTCVWDVDPPFYASTSTEQGSDMRNLDIRIGPGDKVYAVSITNSAAEVYALFFSASE